MNIEKILKFSLIVWSNFSKIPCFLEDLIVEICIYQNNAIKFWKFFYPFLFQINASYPIMLPYQLMLNRDHSTIYPSFPFFLSLHSSFWCMECGTCMVIDDMDACSIKRYVEALLPPTRTCVVELKHVNLLSNANNWIQQFGRNHMLNQIPTPEYQGRVNFNFLFDLVFSFSFWSFFSLSWNLSFSLLA